MDYEPLKYIPEPEHSNLLAAPTRWERITFFFSKFKRAPKPESKPIPNPIPNLSPAQQPSPKSKWFAKFGWKRFSAIFAGGVVIFFVLFNIFISAPSVFPVETILSVKKGETLSGVTRVLENGGVIRSPFIFKGLVTIFGGSRGLVAGDYYLKESQSTWTLAWRLSHGGYGLENIRITIPEGFSSKEISAAFVKTGLFVHFDPTQFQKLASAKEGYLFPDTYLFLPSVTAEEVIAAMTKNYEKRIATIAPQIKSFGRPIKNIIIMASIVEREARTQESRRTIAGILWKRLDVGMPLQVDAAFALVNGKTDSAKITLEDLKINSPYNTYVNKGLPPGPIANPGLDAILATISPIKTNYYFYLSDSAGNMHYGVTHDQHIANKEKYLR